MKQTITPSKIEPCTSKKGQPYLKVTADKNLYFVWDEAAYTQFNEDLLGFPVEVEVEEKDGFKNITKFVQALTTPTEKLGTITDGTISFGGAKTRTKPMMSDERVALDIIELANKYGVKHEEVLAEYKKILGELRK